MGMEKEEKERLAQLGLDRRLAEAVGALDLEAATFIRVAGDENAEESVVMQAASNYRAAVQRRNIAYDRACGVPEDQAGKPDTYVGGSSAPAEIDDEALRKAVSELIPKVEPPKVDEAALSAAVEAELEKRLPAAVTAALEKATAGDGSETRKSPASGGGAKAGG